MNKFEIENVVVIGAGPAGLTAGSELSKDKNLNNIKPSFRVTILEKDDKVGGLSKTTEYKGCKFDIGPHHFITQSSKVEKWWHDLMRDEEKKGNRFISLKRFTRIYYKNHFFNYPLQPINVLRGLSLFECVRCVLSYVKVRFFPIKNVKTFQDEVTNKFGYRLFSIFFKTYTEKVWGIPCTKISADWARERIKGFSLSKAMFYAFFGRWFKKNSPRTLSDIFYYPELGAGTLWEKVANNIEASGVGKIVLNQKVSSIVHKNNKIESVLTYDVNGALNVAKNLHEYKGEHFFSTMPLRELILSLDPLPHDEIIDAAKKLVYRGLVTINFIIKKKDICPDHWLYIHEKEIFMGRIGNMNNFSAKMSDDKEHTSLSLEYFTFSQEPSEASSEGRVNSDFWKKSDDELLELGKIELQKIGLVKKSQIMDGMILRESQAYPVYDKNYKKSLKIVLDYLSNFTNLNLMGRNGLHKYNNMDIAMLSAFKVVDKLLESRKLLKNKNNKNDNCSNNKSVAYTCHPELVSGSQFLNSDKRESRS